MPRRKRPVNHRTAERLVRAAYELEFLAGRLRDGGHERVSEGVRLASRELGKAGRSLLEEVQTRKENP